jgi:hypothetical protein
MYWWVIDAVANRIASGPKTAAANSMTIDAEGVRFTCRTAPFGDRRYAA